MIPDSEPKNQCEAVGEFASAYRATLAAYLGDPIGSRSALGDLSARFGELDLDLLDLAAVHEIAIRECGGGETTVKHGKSFFAELVASTTPHPETGARVDRLARQVEELALSNRQLREEVDRRKVIEESLRHRELDAGETSGSLRERQDEWRLLSRRLLAVQEDEQKLISRELHDVIAQTMTGINVRLAVLRSQTTANAIELHRKIAETERLAEKSVEIVHQFASELHPAVLDDFGLIPALHAFIESFSARTGVTVAIESDPGVDDLPPAIRTALYRIAREALGNIASHPGADRAILSITRVASLVRLEISDDGHGFFPGDDEEEARLGLLGMEERAAMVGGIFRIESSPGHITTATVEIPLAEIFSEAELTRQPLSTSSLS